MNRLAMALFLVSIALTVACGGGGSSDAGVINGGGGSSTITGGFQPDQANPGSDSVALAQGSASADLVTVAVNVTDTDGVYSAAFELFYDATAVEYRAWASGTVLEQDGNQPTYTVQLTSPGHLVIGAARTGGVPTVNVSGTRPLIRFTFKLKKVGNSAVSFQNAGLYDDQIPPQELSGVGWYAGSFVGN